MKSYLDHALAMSPLLHFPEELEWIKIPSEWLYDHHHEENKGVEPTAVDIKETPKEYVFYADVPGLTKSDIQVYVEEENLLVIKCQGGKQKRETVEGTRFGTRTKGDYSGYVSHYRRFRAFRWPRFVQEPN